MNNEQLYTQMRRKSNEEQFLKKKGEKERKKGKCGNVENTPKTGNYWISKKLDNILSEKY